MNDGPLIASIAALIGDPGRANMLTALMDGRALTASELGNAAGVTLQTASGHLSRLVEAGLLSVRKQGRHRQFLCVPANRAFSPESQVREALSKDDFPDPFKPITPILAP